MNNTIFDLEQRIISTWNVIDDVKDISQYLRDNPKFSGMSAEAENSQTNLLSGVVSLYGLKFEKLWECFEEVCEEHHKRGNDLEKMTSPEDWDYQVLLTEKDKQIEDLKLQLADKTRELEYCMTHNDSLRDKMIHLEQQLDELNKLSNDDYLFLEPFDSTQDFVEHEIAEMKDKELRPEYPSSNGWDETRIEIIGQNGNDGLHYPSEFPNKHDE